MRFKKGELSREAFNIIMYDLECLELKKKEDNVYHKNFIIGNLEDIFGFKKGVNER
jgi:hypothetical protein